MGYNEQVPTPRRSSVDQNLHLLRDLRHALAHHEQGVAHALGRKPPMLWALNILKVYPLQAPGGAAVRVSRGAIDPKTHQKWVLVYIKAISELLDVVVSNLQCEDDVEL